MPDCFSMPPKSLGRSPRQSVRRADSANSAQRAAMLADSLALDADGAPVGLGGGRSGRRAGGDNRRQPAGQNRALGASDALENAQKVALELSWPAKPASWEECGQVVAHLMAAGRFGVHNHRQLALWWDLSPQAAERLVSAARLLVSMSCSTDSIRMAVEGVLLEIVTGTGSETNILRAAELLLKARGLLTPGASLAQGPGAPSTPDARQALAGRLELAVTRIRERRASLVERSVIPAPAFGGDPVTVEIGTDGQEEHEREQGGGED